MDIKLKPIGEQVIVITGASSGIGLVTARTAAEAGARVVLAARNENDLAEAVQGIRASGGRAVYQVCDVAEIQQVEALAQRAMTEFGGFDTWVNDAAVSIYGKWTDVPLADARRQFDVNYWGVVHGTLTAVKHLREKGGAIINVASALADRAIPLQGNYAASKFAVKAFTDSLRMELEADGVPISLTLVKPGSMDTPLFQKAKTFLGVEPQPIPPVYTPDVAARVIIAAAEKPIRDIIPGGMGKVVSLGEKLSPRLTDKYMERTTFESQKTDIPASPDRPTNLYEPVQDDGGARGRFQGRVRKWSSYTQAALHPRITAGVVATLGVIAAGARRVRSRRTGTETRPDEKPPDLPGAL
jgi:NAD(P)-dependent dehydrogenase (short-subunit alcohol dehydrogenase family)